MALSACLHSLKNHSIIVWKVYSDVFLDREKLTIKILEKIDVPETHFEIQSVKTKLIRIEEEK